MPSTARLVTILQYQANGWPRPQILAALNDAVNLLRQDANEQSLVFTNGEFPSLTTHDGVYTYDLTDVWRVDEILLALPVPEEYGLAISGEYGYNSEVSVQIENRIYKGKRYIRVGQISTVDRYGVASNSNANRFSNCQVRFHFNPGDTTDVYLYRGYSMADELSSEAIPIPIPEKVHLTAVLPAAMELIKAYQFGNIVEATRLILKEYKPLVTNEMNDGEQGKSNYVERHGA